MRNRNIPYDIRNRLTVKTAEARNIPPRQSSLQTNHNVMTSHLPTQLQCSKNMTMGNTFRQKYFLYLPLLQDIMVILEKRSQVVRHYRQMYMIKT